MDKLIESLSGLFKWSGERVEQELKSIIVFLSCFNGWLFAYTVSWSFSYWSYHCSEFLFFLIENDERNFDVISQNERKRIDEEIKEIEELKQCLFSIES